MADRQRKGGENNQPRHRVLNLPYNFFENDIIPQQTIDSGGVFYGKRDGI
jgi:hypothetical protein